MIPEVSGMVSGVSGMVLNIYGKVSKGFGRSRKVPEYFGILRNIGNF